ncbi:MAG: hypothetical protein HQ549_05200 [Candidatus Omnitrophica bacterium]|nr:hypothetical protein [Candidatus Omnitrophota bacterium]
MSLFITFGSWGYSYAKISGNENDVLSLVEEGACFYEDQRFMFALQKYEEALAIARNILDSEPQNKRISLLKDLTENKIEECKTQIRHIEQDINSKYTYKEKLENAYNLIDTAEDQKNEGRYYVALKKYSHARTEIEFVLKGASDNREAKLLLRLIESKESVLRDEIDALSGKAAEDRTFSREIEKITRLLEKASVDAENQRFLVALKNYKTVLKILNNLEEDFPEKKRRISITKNMTQIAVRSCKEKIKELEEAAEITVTREPEIEEVTRETPIVEKPVIAKPAKRKPAATTSLVASIMPKRAAEVKKPAILEKISKPLRVPERLTQERRIAPQEMAPQRERILPQRELPNFGKYIKNGIINIGRFITTSRGVGRKVTEEVYFINSERRTDLKANLDSTATRLRNYASTTPLVTAERESITGDAPKEIVSVTEEAEIAPAASPSQRINEYAKQVGDGLKQNTETVGNFVALSREAGKQAATEASLVGSGRRAGMLNGFKNFINALRKKFAGKKTRRERVSEPVREVAVEEDAVKGLTIEEVIAEVTVEEVTPEETEPLALLREEEIPGGTLITEEEPAFLETPEVTVEEVERIPEGEWVEARRMRPTGYDFSGYEIDRNIAFEFAGKKFEFESPCLRKGNEIWTPLKELTDQIGLTFMKPAALTVIIIRYDGIPLEMNVGKTEGLVSKQPFLTMRKPLAIYNDNFLLSLGSVKDATGISYKYFPEENLVKFTRGEKPELTMFTIEKPPMSLEEIEKKEAAEIDVPKLPREVREELLPAEYQPDIDLKLDASFRYFEDMFEEKRTRYNEYYLNGRIHDLDVFGHLSMRDYDTSDKHTWKEDAQHLSFSKNNNTLKLLDNYMRLPSVRAQSQPYWGVEMDYAEKDAPVKATFWAGEMDAISIPRSEGSGTVKYFGELYASKQDWVDTDTFKFSATELYVYNKAEFSEDSGATAHPRKNFVYLLDSDWQVFPNFNFYNTYAQSNYFPDNERDKLVSDLDYKTGIKYKHDRFNMNTSFEFIGDKYASIGIPTTYQDYMGWDIGSSFKISKDFSLNMSGTVSRDNVAFNKDETTSYTRSAYTGFNYRLPYDQNISFGWNYGRNLTDGGNEDASGSYYKTYSFDYYKTMGTASLQLGYQYYRADPLGGSTGSNFYHMASATLYKYFPELNGSYIRLYQDLTKTKQLSMNGLPTSSVWNTTLSGRYYLLPYLSFSGDCRLRTAFQDTVANSSIFSFSTGIDYNPSPVTTLSLTYEADNMDLYDTYRSTQDWSVLFLVRHVFDITTPEKWGRIKVYVFEDANGNKKMDKDDKGMKDVLAYVVEGRSAQTNAGGKAFIKKVVPGSRKVRLDMRGLPVDMMIRGDATKDVLVEQLKTSETTFIVVAAGTIEGKIYVDVNDNGIFEEDLDIPVPNARIFLTPEYRDTYSFSDGSFIFEYVYPGEYELNIDTKRLPKQYRLASPSASRPITVEPKDKLEDEDFILEKKTIKIKYF